MAKSTRSPLRRKLIVLAAGVVALAVTVAGCGRSGDRMKLSLVSYSTPQAAYAKLIPAFRETDAGRSVKFSQSYGASGEQSRAVENGLPADVVAFSHSGDVDRLVEAGLVTEDWRNGPTKGIVTHSLVVFAVRPGNPKGIKNWSDLTKAGVDVIAPNPIVSGGARWNVLAAYLQARVNGANEGSAIAYVQQLQKNVSVQDKSARESLQTFTSGKGDVLVTYENEAIAAKNADQELDYVIPTTTLLVENPIAVTSDSKSPPAAEAFVDFLISDEGQRIFAESGYRPVDDRLVDPKVYPAPEKLITVGEHGGWAALAKQFFDKETGVVTKINERLGVDGN